MAADMTAVPPEAYEAARAAIADEADPWRTESGPTDDWVMAFARAAVDAVWSLGVAEGRRQAAEAIRAEAAETTSFGYSAVRVAIDASDEHPFMIGLEWAARIAEGNTDSIDRSSSGIES